MNTVINFILFQALWLSCVLGAASSNFMFAWCVLIALFTLSVFNPDKRDLKFLLVFASLGFAVDSSLLAFQWVNYQPYVFHTTIAPLWILFLWIGFALSLRWSMSWMFKKPKLAYLLLAVGGPLSYFGAEKLNAIEIIKPLQSSLFIAVSWTVIFFLVSQTPDSKRLAHAQ